ncbi:MAG: TrkA family potassium uptake protein [Opitutae bacterium]|nr:TrkA family potassium uptake protein [Opitutae bacterium]
MPKRIFILGGGRFGVHLATRLCEFGCEVVIADADAERVKDLSADGFHAIEMDANDETALKDSGALTADVTVVAIGENMQASILATLLLKQYQARRVVSRALDAKHAQVLERLGADEVILPVRDMAYRLAERLREGAQGERQPLVGAFLLAEIPLGARLAGQGFDAARLREDFEVNAVLLKQAEGDRAVVHEPSPGIIFSEGDILWLIGTREHLHRFERQCGRGQ